MFPINSLFRTPSFNPQQQASNSPISTLGTGIRRKPQPLAPSIAPTPDVSPTPQLEIPRPAPLPAGSRDLLARNGEVGGRVEAMPYQPAMDRGQPLPLSDIRPQQMGQLQAPRMIPRPDVPTLEGRMVAPGSYDAQRRDYLMQGVKRNPDGTIAEGKDGGMQFKRSGKDIAMAALAGLGRGGILGAMTGALGATISPKFGREMNWEMYQKPRALEEEGRAMQQQQTERQNAIEQLRMQRELAGIDSDQAQAELNRVRAQMALRPEIKPLPVDLQTMIDEATGQPALVNMKDPANIGKPYRPYEKPQRESLGDMIRQAEIQQEASEDPQKISNDSYNARGGDQYVFSKLPAQTQEILTKGTIGGQAATMEEVATARRMFTSEIDRQKKADLEFTQAEDKKKKAQRAVGKLPGPASATGTRSLRELVNQNFGKP